MKKWRVKLKTGGTVVVHSDYFKIEGGALIFRNAARRCNMGYQHSPQYPEVVRAFAHGVWRDVAPQET